MPEPEMRAALLQQDGPTMIEAELKLLHGLIQSESRRARWLKFWTIAVWAVFFALVAVLVVAAPFTIERAPDVPQGVQPPIPAAPNDPVGPGAILFLIALLLLALVSLPAAGIVLLILMVLAQRSATVAQLRASVATIDAQVKLLAVKHATPSSVKC